MSSSNYMRVNEYAVDYRVIDDHGVSVGSINVFVRVPRRIYPGSYLNISLFYYGSIKALFVEIKVFLRTNNKAYILGRLETEVYAGKYVVEKIPLYIDSCNITGVLGIALNGRGYDLILDRVASEPVITYACP